MVKSITVGISILLGAVLANGCARSLKPGGEIEIELDDAAAIVALEQADDERASDFAGTEGLASAASDCNFDAVWRDLAAHYDVDRNGALDARELTRLRRDFGGRTERGRPRQVARLERIKLLRWIYDQNADRTLDARERDALREDLNARCQNDAAGAARDPRAATERRAYELREFDSDHDGRLDAREEAAAWNAARQRVESHWETLIDRFDADRDGLLSPGERAALREYERSVIRGERPIPLPEEHFDAGAARDASNHD